MSQALANFSVFLPLSSGRRRTKSVGGGLTLKAMAKEARDNLDHLQRATQQQRATQHQSQPKKRVAPTPPVGLWDRFPTARTVQQMMETMERMMDDPLVYSGQSGGWARPLPTESGGYSRGRTPWEIKEAETEYKMRFDMPGMTKEDVKVWVEEKMLVVKAEKAAKKKDGSGMEEEEEGEEWSAKSYGRYSSRIALPENIQFEKIKAEVKDGVLYITIPKAMSSSKILDINVQ
ncbi:PREDICTED: small heat shock protein, chloroplastic-like [Fragaria vesca subsp. vesca]|uniref:small heat shock protein, chloroplastic-like n=1 Tax=Fragaria vesca subsp. vesca TaxID=101020 RepID=UPI0002C342E7|nr:PREDICTED: small heat shock protein, chloroplastic-like [Fragaria vesca subsp. vesca]